MARVMSYGLATYFLGVLFIGWIVTSFIFESACRIFGLQELRQGAGQPTIHFVHVLGKHVEHKGDY